MSDLSTSAEAPLAPAPPAEAPPETGPGAVSGVDPTPETSFPPASPSSSGESLSGPTSSDVSTPLSSEPASLAEAEAADVVEKPIDGPSVATAAAAAASIRPSYGEQWARHAAAQAPPPERAPWSVPNTTELARIAHEAHRIVAAAAGDFRTSWAELEDAAKAALVSAVERVLGL